MNRNKVYEDVNTTGKQGNKLEIETPGGSLQNSKVIATAKQSPIKEDSKKKFVKRSLQSTDKKSISKSPVPNFAKFGQLSGPGSRKSIQKSGSGRKKLFNVRKDDNLRSDHSHHRNSASIPRVNAFNPGKKM